MKIAILGKHLREASMYNVSLEEDQMKRFGLVLVMVVVCACFSAPALADVEIGKLDEAFDAFTIGGEINVYYRYDSNPWFGSKTAWGEDSTNYGETFSRIRFTATKDLGWSQLSGQLAPFYAETVGKDFYAVYDNQQEIGIDQAWLKFAKIAGSTLDLTVGRQDIAIEKLFVVAGGEDQGTANWLYLHNSFPLAARLDGEYGALKGSLFYAEVGDYVKDWTDLFAGGVENDINLTGLNLHYDLNEKIFFYSGVFYKNEAPASEGGVGNEDDTTAFDVGLDVTLFGLQLEGEYVKQTGDSGVSGDIDRDANAYFASATYRFNIPLAPYLRAMYISFSGDDPDTNDNEEYDPMFIGFRDWNRWIIGELVGEAHLPNSNKNDFILEAGFSPKMPMMISLMYIQHKLEEQETLVYGPVSSDEWADEWNLFVDWPLSENLFAHLGAGYVTPGDAAKELLGSDDDAFFTQLWFNFSF
jgi:hypothetical protein